MSISRQMSGFFIVGLFATVAHYSALIGLVELAGWMPVPATLIGFLFGGATSYVLTRRHVFETERSHAEAIWRFVIVAGVGFLLTWGLMTLLVNHLALPYLPAQVLTTGLVFFWSFGANKFWTFKAG